MVEYSIGDDVVSQPFRQRVSFSHDSQAYLNYSAQSWIEGEDGANTPLTAEIGYWRLTRKLIEGDPGPAMLPPTAVPPFGSTESVETLRNSAGGFDITVSIIHPTGVSELYLGQVKSGRIDLATDAVVRAEGAKDYSAATRIYGLVEGDLLWAWDIAALGQSLRTHASGRMARVD